MAAPPFRLAAYSRISCEMFMEQYLGPHMEQKCAVFAGS